MVRAVLVWKSRLAETGFMKYDFLHSRGYPVKFSTNASKEEERNYEEHFELGGARGGFSWSRPGVHCPRRPGDQSGIGRDAVSFARRRDADRPQPNSTLNSTVSEGST